MKPRAMLSRTKSGARAAITLQQAVFELKQRVVLSLNKLTDRDTHQIGVEELEKVAAGLNPEGIAPFLACILDTDSEQKSAVRRECVRLLGTLARLHGALLVPHIGKMVTAIVKRLKDSDSVVRDACVETAGVLATSVRSSTNSEGAEPVFIAIVRPLFEALGEQNRYVQTGSALCLARVIDVATDPPASVLPQMLTRVVKLLKNPHFLPKPALIELIRSIIQAGGAPTEQALSTAVTSIRETLKSTDWTVRKAASVALAGIAVYVAGPLLGSIRTSCIRSLEGCRFDKVKPVRDTVLHALQCWRTIPGTDSREPLEAGSSMKENMNGDYADVTSDGGWRDISFSKGGPFSADITNVLKRRDPLTLRKTCPNSVQNLAHPSSNDWHVKISLPKAYAISSVENQPKDFGESPSTESFERAAFTRRGQDAKYDYDPAEEKAECSSVSEIVSGSFETKHITIDEGNSSALSGFPRNSVTEDVDPMDRRMQECKSLDSIVTDLSSDGMHGCCLQTASELAFIKKQLLEIETKQSNLLDLLQVFMGNSVHNMSTLQSTVHSLEQAVDKITKSKSLNGSYYSVTSSKPMKDNHNVTCSPRLSTSTPRSSVESNYRQPSLSSLRSKEVWGINSSSISKPRTSIKEGEGLHRDPTVNIVQDNLLQKVSRTVQNTASCQAREARDLLSVSACNATSKQSEMEGKSGFWKQIEESLHSGDMETAYTDALSTGDDLYLFELMDRTGPVLERLSCETNGTIVSILTTYFLDRKFMDSIIPWFLQVMDLSSLREPWHLSVSSKTRMDFLCAIREAASMEFIDREDRIAMTEFAVMLSKRWSEAPSRKMLPTRRTTQGSKILLPATRA